LLFEGEKVHFLGRTLFLGNVKSSRSEVDYDFPGSWLGKFRKHGKGHPKVVIFNVENPATIVPMVVFDWTGVTEKDPGKKGMM